jgi:hypothetical protein
MAADSLEWVPASVQVARDLLPAAAVDFGESSSEDFEEGNFAQQCPGHR